MEQLVSLSLEELSVLVRRLSQLINHANHRKTILNEAFFLHLSLFEGSSVVLLRLLTFIRVEDKWLLCIISPYSFTKAGNHRIFLSEAILNRSIRRHVHHLFLIILTFLHERQRLHATGYLVLVVYSIEGAVSH